MYLGQRIRIAIVDNDRLTVGMMKLAIGHLLPLAEICWTAFTGADAVRRSLDKGTRPDVLIVDMSLEGMNGVEVCRRIRSRTAQVALIGVTAFSLERYYAAALENGAACLIDKAKVRDICSAIRLLANGKPAGMRYESSETARDAHARLAAEGDTSHDHADLTKREEEVMNLCALGYTSKEIGARLGIGEPTVKTYIKRVVDKMQARNRTQAVIRWLKEKDR